jgi:hypothetical protein
MRAATNRVTRHGVAALDPDGVPTSLDPDAGPGGPNTFNDVHAIAVRGDAIYLGGNFTSIGGQPRNRIAKVAPDGTLDPTFNPNATGGNIPGIDTIVVTDSDAYAGGDFSTIGGQPRLDLAKLNPVTGLVDGGRQSFDPDPLNGVNLSRVRTLQVPGDEVYVGGDFTTIGGRSRNKLAKISGTTGDVDVQCDANVSGGSNVGAGISEIVLARGTLFVGGDFSSIGGAAHNNAATLNPKPAAGLQQTSCSGCGSWQLIAAYSRPSPGRIGASSRRASPRYRTCTWASPWRSKPSSRAAAYDRSISRPSTNGPRSLTRRIRLRPFSRFTTSTTLGSCMVGCAAVSAYMS